VKNVEYLSIGDGQKFASYFLGHPVVYKRRDALRIDAR